MHPDELSRDIEPRNEAQRLDDLLSTTRREMGALPPVKPVFIVASFVLAAFFLAALAAMVAGMLGDDHAAPVRGGMSNVLGLLFFLMPTVLMLRYGVTRLVAARRLARLKRLARMLSDRRKALDAG